MVPREAVAGGHNSYVNKITKNICKQKSSEKVTHRDLKGVQKFFKLKGEEVFQAEGKACVKMLRL